ncbi:caffeoylshikimate esterase-like [Miscanthus floridulus]|uniref:caffeoylshikimate esterase-like n=1 Tax=Miscanthus floridulus TaxID=154761 RepID=UPI003459151D
MCPTNLTAVAPLQGHHRTKAVPLRSPQRHCIFTGPLVIVSTALDAYCTDGIGVYAYRCAEQRSWKIIPTPDIIDKVCKDPEMRKQVRSNPYIYRGKLPLKTCHELLMVSLDIEKNLNQVTMPFLVLHGGDDIVTDPSVSKLLFEKASSKDKTFKLYPGMWHALTAELPDDVERVYLEERAICTASVSSATSRV